MYSCKIGDGIANLIVYIYSCNVGDNLSISEDMIASIDERRNVAANESEESAPEIATKKKDAYIDLIMRMDEIEDERDRQNAAYRQEGIEMETHWLLSGDHL